MHRKTFNYFNHLEFTNKYNTHYFKIFVMLYLHFKTNTKSEEQLEVSQS